MMCAASRDGSDRSDVCAAPHKSAPSVNRVISLDKLRKHLYKALSLDGNGGDAWGVPGMWRARAGAIARGTEWRAIPLHVQVKGSGLGLFIVRAIARRHGGDAHAESEGPGRGTTVIIELPRNVR